MSFLDEIVEQSVATQEKTSINVMFTSMLNELQC